MKGFERRLVRITKVTVLIAATWTGACAATLVVVQALSWLRDDEWDAFPLSVFISRRHGATYRVASSSHLDTDRIDLSQILDWLLGIPAILPLLIAFVALIAFWMRLSKIERA